MDNDVKGKDENSLLLSLGDVVNIVSPMDESMDGLNFLITYIDSSLIELISENGKKIELSINKDSSLSNEYITEMNIIMHDPERGYARQNELIPYKWVDIYFGGDIPAVITANIIDIVEDQIELKTTDGDIIYIDFSYKGLPKNIPIKRFVIREAPTTVVPLNPVVVDEEHKEKEETEEKYDEEKKVEKTLDIPPQSLLDEANYDDEFKDNIQKDDDKQIELENENMLLSADQIKFGSELESIQQFVDVPESEQRFTMENQIEDLINDMIQSLPPEIEQNQKKINEIKIIAERYRQLRDDTSVHVDESGRPIEKGPNYKPIIESLKQMNKKLYWILPVVKNVKKIYDVKDYDENISDDVKILNSAETIKAESELYNDFMNNKEDDKYQTFIKKVDPYIVPFSEPLRDDENNKRVLRVKDNITAVVDNLGDLESSVVSDKSYIRKKRFLIQEYNLGLNTIEINKKRGGNIPDKTSSSVVVKIKPITESDKMTIKSILTLPKPVIEFSHVNLPTTSILKRSNLNQHFISLWRLLNDKTIVSKTQPINDKSLFKDTHLWEDDDEEEEIDALKFERFLDKIIPSSSSLFNLVKDGDSKSQTNLSLAKFVEKLEPFLIYMNDISVKQYEKMKKYIELKLKEFNNKMDKNRKEFGLLDSNDTSENGKQQFIKSFFEEKAFEELRDAYGIQTIMNDSEFIEYCIKIDNGRFLNAFFSFLDNNITITSSEIDKIVEEENKGENVAELDVRLDEIKRASKVIANAKYLSEKRRLKTILENKKKKDDMFSIKFNIIEKDDSSGNGKDATVDALISPIFEKLEQLRDSIIGQKDEKKRFTDILLFVKKYTKTTSDDKFWLYDIATNQKIIPTFLVKIANTFINNKKEYANVVDKICKEQGKVGDDGDTVVDKYSGYIIKTIDFDTDEGFTEEGFRRVTRSELTAEEKDDNFSESYNIGNALEDAQNIVENDDVVERIGMVDIEATKYELSKRLDLIANPLSKTILNVVNAISANIGVFFNSESIEFIVENTINTFEASIRTKEQYNEMALKLKDKKKSMEPYDIHYNKTLLVLTLCYLLATIQTSIPPIVPKKSFPGCKSSFDGYPFINDDSPENEQGMNYIMCVAHKIRKNNEEPWKSIEKANLKDLLKYMKRLFNAVIDNSEIIKRMEARREYNEQYPQILENGKVIKETDVKKWDGFLPAISPIDVDIKKIEPLSKLFYDTLQTNIINGSPLQEDNINTAYGKSLYYALYIQQLIKIGVLQNKSILRTKTNIPYFENSCCNDGNRNPLAYFTSLYTDIKKYMKLFTEVNNLIYKMKTLRTAPILFHPFDTKRRITTSNESEGFTEETYYQAFYYFCKYREKLPFGDEIRKICKEDDDNKDGGFDIDISTKMKRLKESGYEINQELFEKLMDFINNKNKFEITYDHEERKDDKNDNLSSILINISQDNTPEVPEMFITLLNTLINGTKTKSDVDEAEKKLLDYIFRENSSLSKKIKEFLEKNATGETKKEIKKWNATYLDKTLFTIKDISFLKHSILALSTKLPNNIINDVSSKKTYIPKHWGLSSKHESNLTHIIDQTTSLLDNITSIVSDNREIKQLLENIQKKTSIFQSLSKNTFLPQSQNRSILSEKLYLFYLLNIINVYIKTTEQSIMALRPSEIKTLLAQKQFNDSSIKSLSTCTLIIKTFVTIICDEAKKVIVSYKKLTDKISDFKESEKNIMTKKLNMLTTDERKVEKVFKENKLGKWGKGLEKGLRIYQRETYDTEMEEKDAIDKEKMEVLDILLQKGIDKNGNPVEATDQNEIMMENEEEDRIEREELRLKGGENEEDDYDYEADL